MAGICLSTIGQPLFSFVFNFFSLSSRHISFFTPIEWKRDLWVTNCHVPCLTCLISDRYIFSSGTSGHYVYVWWECAMVLALVGAVSAFPTSPRLTLDVKQNREKNQG